MNYLYLGLLLKNGELGLVEVSQIETNYRRIEMNPGDWFYLNEDSKEDITNAINVEFPDATGLWGMITHFGIFDSLYDGHLLVAGTLNNKEFICERGKTEFKMGKIKIPSDIFGALSFL